MNDGFSCESSARLCLDVSGDGDGLGEAKKMLNLGKMKMKTKKWKMRRPWKRKKSGDPNFAASVLFLLQRETPYH